MADQPPHRSGTRRIAIWSVVAILLVVGIGWAGLHLLNAKSADDDRRAEEQRHWCAGLDALSGPGFDLHRVDDGQCVGWTVERDHAFGSTDARVAPVVHQIVTENLRVRDHSVAYLRIGVMLPMTSVSNSSALLNDSILHSLEGAYAAQRQANSGASALGDPTLQVQLVLINEGADQRNWTDESVVPALGTLRDGPHPLVAVTGMGISIPAAPAAATALHNLGIPTIGAVLTADDMVAPDLFKVSPSNHQYAQALQAFLTAQSASPKSQLPETLSGYLVFDRNPADNYVQSLNAAFMDTFGESMSLADRSRGFNGSLAGNNERVFELHVNDICALQPEVVFYAGRDRDLQALIDALGHRRCAKKPMLLATGSTGMNISASGLEDARIGILDASSTDPQGWQAGGDDAPQDYAAFHTLFTGTDTTELGFPEADLADGYAIMHHDAVAAAVRAARWHYSAAVDASSAVPATGLPAPTAAAVRDALYSISATPIPGASGGFYFREKPQNDLWPIGKPVPVIRLGSVATKLPQVSTFVTKCQIRKHPEQPTNYETEDCPY